MNFIINRDIVHIKDYRKLELYNNEYPECEFIVAFLNKWFDPKVSKFEFQTSGSTGAPKKILHSRDALKTSANLTAQYFGFLEGQVTLLCLPVKYISGCMMLVRSIVSEMDLVISKVATNVFDGVALPLNKSIDFAPMTPMQFQFAYENNLDNLSRIKCILLGGAPLTLLHESYLKAFKKDVFLGYGMTETVTHIALKRVSGNITSSSFFNLLPTFKIELDHNKCLKIEAPHLNEVIQTTDIVDLLSPSRFIWKGRLDNIINSGGVKVSPEEIEVVISEKLKRSVLISSVHDDKLGEKIICVMEEAQLEGLTAESIKVAIGELNLGVRRPRVMSFVEEFPKTPTGKIKRDAIKNLIKTASVFKL